MKSATDLLKTRTTINIGAAVNANVSLNGDALSGTVFWISDDGARLGFKDWAGVPYFVSCDKVRLDKNAPLPLVTRGPNIGQIRCARSGITSAVKLTCDGKTRWAPTELFLRVVAANIAAGAGEAMVETYADGWVRDEMHESYCDSVAAARAERDYR